MHELLPITDKTIVVEKQGVITFKDFPILKAAIAQFNEVQLRDIKFRLWWGLINEDDIKELKSVKALFNANAKVLNRHRIDAKDELMIPYDNLDKQTKELVADMDKAISPIEQILKDFEFARFEKKKDAIQKIFNDLMFKYPSIKIRLNLVFEIDVLIPRWLNKGETIKKITAELESKFEKFDQDIQAMKLDQHFERILTVYKQNGHNYAFAKETVLKAVNQEIRIKVINDQELKRKGIILDEHVIKAQADKQKPAEPKEKILKNPVSTKFQLTGTGETVLVGWNYLRDIEDLELSEISIIFRIKGELEVVTKSARHLQSITGLKINKPDEED